MEQVQSIRFTVPGVPVGKARPRFWNRNGRYGTYTEERTREYENRVRAAYLAKYRHVKMSGTLQVDVIGREAPQADDD